MALISYNFRNGVDVPTWEWMAQHPQGFSYHGCAVATDGRCIYTVMQSGSTGTTASTTQLWRFDTFVNGWQFLATVASGNRGIDIDYDPVRKVVWILHGADATTWQYFNLNATSITLAGQTVIAFAISANIATVLPNGADYGSSIIVPNDLEILDPIDAGTVDAGTTASVLVENTTPSFHLLMDGMYVEYTSGANIGLRRLILTVDSTSQITHIAFPTASSAGDTYKIVLPRETASSATSSTVVRSGAGWTTNAYANLDVEIIGGTGVGQRRRIVSNTSDTITLAAAVAGNPRTGAWSPTPDATSVFVIKPSNDWVYFQPGSGGQQLYRIDVVATTLTWVTLNSTPGSISSGGDLKHLKGLAPFYLIQQRGNATNNIYVFNMASLTWSTFSPNLGVGGETFSTGSTSINIPGKRKVFYFKESSQRTSIFDVVTGEWSPGPLYPYAAGSGYDGKRASYIVAADGVSWIYYIRPGGQEFLRLALEWL